MKVFLSCCVLCFAATVNAADYRCRLKVENLPVTSSDMVEPNAVDVVFYRIINNGPPLYVSDVTVILSANGNYTITFPVNLPAAQKWMFAVYDDDGPFNITTEVFHPTEPGRATLKHPLKDGRIRPASDTSEQIRMNQWSLED